MSGGKLEKTGIETSVQPELCLATPEGEFTPAGSDACIETSPNTSQPADNFIATEQGAEPNRGLASSLFKGTFGRLFGSKGPEPVTTDLAKIDHDNLTEAISALRKLEMYREVFEDGGFSYEGLIGAKLLLEYAIGRPLTYDEWPEEGSRDARIAILNTFAGVEKELRGRIINFVVKLVPAEDLIIGPDPNDGIDFARATADTRFGVEWAYVSSGGAGIRTVVINGKEVNFQRLCSQLTQITDAKEFAKKLGEVVNAAHATSLAAGVERLDSQVKALQAGMEGIHGNILDNWAQTMGDKDIVPLQSSHPDYEKYEASNILSQLAAMGKVLNSAAERLGSGEIEEAKELMLGVAGSDYIKKIPDMIGLQRASDTKNRLKVTVSSIILASALMEVTAAYLHPVLLDVFGTSRGGILAADTVESLAGAAVFSTTNTVVESALNGDPLPRPAEFGKDILYTAGMFKVIGSAMNVYKETVARALYAMAAKRLLAEGTIKAEGLATKEAQELIAKEARLGPFGKTLETSFGFTFEAGAFQAWEYGKMEIERHVFGANVTPDMAFEMMTAAEGAKSLAAIKFGLHFIGRPMTLPLREASQKHLAKEYKARIDKIGEQTARIVQRISEGAKGAEKTDIDAELQRLEGLGVERIALFRDMYRRGLATPEGIALAEASLAAFRSECERVSKEAEAGAKELAEPRPQPDIYDRLIAFGGPVGITPWAGREMPRWLKGLREFFRGGKKAEVGNATPPYNEIQQKTLQVASELLDTMSEVKAEAEARGIRNPLSILNLLLRGEFTKRLTDAEVKALRKEASERSQRLMTVEVWLPSLDGKPPVWFFRGPDLERPELANDGTEQRRLATADANIIVDNCPFGVELRRYALEHHKTSDPLQILNLFLRGELGREPTHAEVQKLALIMRSGIGEFARNSVFMDPTSVGQPIFQVYTREFLDVCADYLVELIKDFRTRYGREPRITEICAGDGRFARALNTRLASRGYSIRIQATDLGKANRWKIEPPPDVLRMDAVRAARGADIILGSWLPPGDKLDLEIGKMVEKDPSKTMVIIGEPGAEGGITGSRDGSRFLNERMRHREPGSLNREVDGVSLPVSRLDFDVGLRGAFTTVEVFRSRRAPSPPDPATHDGAKSDGATGGSRKSPHETAPPASGRNKASASQPSVVIATTVDREEAKQAMLEEFRKDPDTEYAVYRCKDGRYLVVRGNKISVTQPEEAQVSVAHTHPKGRILLPSRQDIDVLALGERGEIFSITEDGAVVSNSYKKVGDGICAYHGPDNGVAGSKVVSEFMFYAEYSVEAGSKKAERVRVPQGVVKQLMESGDSEATADVSTVMYSIHDDGTLDEIDLQIMNRIRVRIERGNDGRVEWIGVARQWQDDRYYTISPEFLDAIDSVEKPAWTGNPPVTIRFGEQSHSWPDDKYFFVIGRDSHSDLQITSEPNLGDRQILLKRGPKGEGDYRVLNFNRANVIVLELLDSDGRVIRERRLGHGERNGSDALILRAGEHWRVRVGDTEIYLDIPATTHDGAKPDGAKSDGARGGSAKGGPQESQPVVPPAEARPAPPPPAIPPRTRTPGAPRAGVKGRYEARPSHEEWADGLQGPNTSSAGPDADGAARPLGRARHGSGHRPGYPGRRAPGMSMSAEGGGKNDAPVVIKASAEGLKAEGSDPKVNILTRLKR